MVERFERDDRNDRNDRSDRSDRNDRNKKPEQNMRGDDAYRRELEELQKVDFALVELTLYLDTRTICTASTAPWTPTTSS